MISFFHALNQSCLLSIQHLSFGLSNSHFNLLNTSVHGEMSTEKLNKAIANFRSESVQSKELLNRYKVLYLKECRVAAAIHKNLQKAQNNLRVKEEEICSLKKEISILKKKKKRPNRKSWSQISCIRTKRRRLSDLKKQIFNVLKEFGSIHTAHVSLKIGDRNVLFKWFRKDFFTPVQSTDPNDQTPVDHSYTDSLVDENDGNEDTDIDYSDIFEEDGKFTKRHLQKAVYVCDKYRISQEAYHELRMELRGHYPPIWIVKLQKNIMSQRIVYFPHDTVNESFKNYPRKALHI